MIRHILEGEFLYHQILKGRGSEALTNLSNTFDTKEFTSVEDELIFAQPYRVDFLKYIKTFNNSDLENIKINRSVLGYIRTL
jgi:predicted nuclease of restriction endonuclease-like (RecB) superfamily